MARRARSDVPEPAASRHGVVPDQWASRRRLYLDNLKVLLIAAVIAGHAVIGYSELDWWSYSDVREATLAPVTVAALFVVAAPFALFVVPLLFLAAGLLTPRSLERKGTRDFVRDRLLRLGVPFAVFALLLWPLLEYALFRLLGNPTALLAEGSLDTGVLWFVGALLVFSLVYAGWVRLRGTTQVRRSRTEIRVVHLLALVVAVSTAAFLVRLVVPFEADTRFVDLNFYQWPASAGLFTLGLIAAGHGWLAAVPDRLRRHSRLATLIAVAAVAGIAGYGLTAGGDFEQIWGGGWHWQAIAFAAVESALAVFGSVWLLAAAQQHLNRSFWWAPTAAQRSAYAAFLLQGLVLFGLAAALRPLPVVAEVKALLVASIGVVAAYALAWLLISRIPGVGWIV